MFFFLNVHQLWQWNKHTKYITPSEKDRKWELKEAGKLKREKVRWVAFIDLSVCAGDQQALADELHFLLAAIVRMFFHCWSINWRTSVSEKWRTLLILGRAGCERVSCWVPASLVPSWGTLTEGAICGWDDVRICGGHHYGTAHNSSMSITSLNKCEIWQLFSLWYWGGLICKHSFHGFTDKFDSQEQLKTEIRKQWNCLSWGIKPLSKFIMNWCCRYISRKFGLP